MDKWQQWRRRWQWRRWRQQCQCVCISLLPRWINYSFMSRSLEYGDDDPRDQHFIMYGSLLTKYVCNWNTINLDRPCILAHRSNELNSKQCAFFPIKEIKRKTTTTTKTIQQQSQSLTCTATQQRTSIWTHRRVFGWNSYAAHVHRQLYGSAHYTHTHTSPFQSSNEYALAYIRANCVHSPSLKITIKLVDVLITKKKNCV